jgi:hypothetical protein
MAGLHGRQAFAARTAASGERGASAAGFLAGKKPVLPLAADFRGLVLAFHKIKIRCVLAAKRAAQHNNQPACVKARFEPIRQNNNIEPPHAGCYKFWWNGPGSLR